MDEYYDAINKVAQGNNAWSAAQAQKQMDFQERMSSTAHQREVEDLRAAGLNPVLSAHTQGASTPNGSLPSVDQGNTEAMYGLMSKMLDAQLASAEAVSSVSSGSVSSGNSASGSNSYPVSGFINSLPDKGNTRLFGISLPNATWKYLYNQYGSNLEKFVVDNMVQLIADSNPNSSASVLNKSIGNSKFANGVYNARYDQFGKDNRYNSNTAPSYGTRVEKKLKSDAKNMNVVKFVIENEDSFYNLGETVSYWMKNHKK